jgi:hypothetical protein
MCLIELWLDVPTGRVFESQESDHCTPLEPYISNVHDVDHVTVMFIEALFCAR